ncbi:MAG: LacI family DNA-binding transcriptional regulator [Pseudomonadota bacterium]
MGRDTRKPPNSYDVARAAGVSRSTVSRALGGGANVSPEVRDRVVRAADTLGYRVNALARGLQTRQSDLVGVVASRLDTPFRATQVRAIAQTLLQRQMHPLLLVADGGEDVDALIKNLLGYSLAGVIVTSDSPPAEVIEACHRLSVPVVLVNRGPGDVDADRVAMDVDLGGQIAFDTLLDAGARKLALVTPRAGTYSVAGRAEAFLRNAEAAITEVLIIETQGQSYTAGAAVAGDVAARADEIDGVFCTTDLLALGLLDRLRTDHGVRVPEDVQIVGFDDIEQAGWDAYRLSTVRQDVVAQATGAVDLVADRLSEPTAPFRSLVYPLAPVLRETTHAPNRRIAVAAAKG